MYVMQIMTPESNLGWWNHHCNGTDRRGMKLLNASMCVYALRVATQL